MWWRSWCQCRSQRGHFHLLVSWMIRCRALLVSSVWTAERDYCIHWVHSPCQWERLPIKLGKIFTEAKTLWRTNLLSFALFLQQMQQTATANDSRRMIMIAPATAPPIITWIGRPSFGLDVVGDGGVAPITHAGWISRVSISKSHLGFRPNLFPCISIEDEASIHSLMCLVRFEQSLASTPCNLAL